MYIYVHTYTGSSTSQVFLVQNGTKHGIPSVSVFTAHGWDFDQVGLYIDIYVYIHTYI
jgi:hypothetical protein